MDAGLINKVKYALISRTLFHFKIIFPLHYVLYLSPTSKSLEMLVSVTYVNLRTNNDSKFFPAEA